VAGNRITGSKNILVMVDDGHRTTLDAYNAVFKPMGIKPLLAVYPGIIGRRTFALSWESLAMMKKEGCEIASHGYFHEYFSEKFFREHPDRFNEEFYRSKSVLEAKLGGSVTEIIYPFGITSDIAKQTLTKAGYRYAFSLRQAPLSVPVPEAEVLDLPRYMMTRSGAKGILRQLVGN
jgi:peptidoglycan/xylan/chitin deacetylase (PgdA/CDA1 family)